jgi:hypothetical protein
MLDGPWLLLPDRVIVLKIPFGFGLRRRFSSSHGSGGGPGESRFLAGKPASLALRALRPGFRLSVRTAAGDGRHVAASAIEAQRVWQQPPGQ